MRYKPLLIKIAENERYRKYYFKLNGELYSDALAYHFYKQDSIGEKGIGRYACSKDRLDILTYLLLKEYEADEEVDDEADELDDSGFFKVKVVKLKSDLNFSNTSGPYKLIYALEEEGFITRKDGKFKIEHDFVLNIFDDYVTKREEANELNPR